jgi:hypothetical protein
VRNLRNLKFLGISGGVGVRWTIAAVDISKAVAACFRKFGDLSPAAVKSEGI